MPRSLLRVGAPPQFHFYRNTPKLAAVGIRACIFNLGLGQLNSVPVSCSGA